MGATPADSAGVEMRNQTSPMIQRPTTDDPTASAGSDMRLHYDEIDADDTVGAMRLI